MRIPTHNSHHAPLASKSSQGPWDYDTTPHLSTLPQTTWGQTVHTKLQQTPLLWACRGHLSLSHSPHISIKVISIDALLSFYSACCESLTLLIKMPSPELTGSSSRHSHQTNFCYVMRVTKLCISWLERPCEIQCEEAWWRKFTSLL